MGEEGWNLATAGVLNALLFSYLFLGVAYWLMWFLFKWFQHSMEEAQQWRHFRNRINDLIDFVTCDDVEPEPELEEENNEIVLTSINDDKSKTNCDECGQQFLSPLEQYPTVHIVHGPVVLCSGCYYAAGNDVR